MANLTSPGVSVIVSDESAYAAAGSGTIPLFILATRENKTDPTGTYTDGIAKYTKSLYTSTVLSITSQRELTQNYGLPVFRKSGSVIVEGDETHEYGLLAAYSYLGQGSQAYVLRADIDLGSLEPTATAPVGPLALDTYWLDTDASTYGIFTHDGTKWVAQTPLVEVVYATASTPTTPAVLGKYLVLITHDDTLTKMTYFVGTAGPAWTKIDSDSTPAAVFSPHYSVPASTAATWIKTTTPGNGLNLKMYAADIFGVFQPLTIQGVSVDAGSTYKLQDGTSTADITTLTNSAIQLVVTNSTSAQSIELKKTVNNAAVAIVDIADAVQLFYAETVEPVGSPVDNQLWFDPTTTALDILKRDTSGWTRVLAANIVYSLIKPSKKADGVTNLAAGDIWVDLSASESEYPKLYRYVGSDFVLHDNTDQTTDYGVLFADIFADNTTLITDAPNYLLYPKDMLAINMCRSSNTVRQYDTALTTTWKWRNAAANAANGSGSFGRLAQRKLIATKMQSAITSNESLREQTKQFTLLCAPNFPEVTDELIELNSARGETGYIVIDVPMRKTPTEAATWVQGTNATENGEDGLVSKNTYSAAYYPSVRTTTPSGDTVTAPASHSVMYQFAYNDNVAYPWFAAAGLTRGVVQNATSAGYIGAESEFKTLPLSAGQRDLLYTNKVNPIATFPGEGVVVFGNKSLSPASTALDRVNVGRLVAYLKERFEIIGRPFLFEPNDKPTRDRIKAVYENFLFDIMSKRGVSDFFVLVDESNNTATRIDRNELWIDIGIVPTKSSEFIYIPLRILNTSAI